MLIQKRDFSGWALSKKRIDYENEHEYNKMAITSNLSLIKNRIEYFHEKNTLFMLLGRDSSRVCLCTWFNQMGF
jgi:hypothetical protein